MNCLSDPVFVYSWGTVLLCSQGRPWTYNPLSASWDLQACTSQVVLLVCGGKRGYLYSCVCLQEVDIGSLLLLSIFSFLRQDPSLSLELMGLTRLVASKPQKSSCVFPAVGAGVCHCALLYLWVLGTQTHFLVIVSTFINWSLPSIPPPSPQSCPLLWRKNKELLGVLLAYFILYR